jgi:polyisoprenoid-binding protein YceI
MGLKLKGVSSGRKIRLAGALFLAGLVTGCPAPPRPAPTAAPPLAPAPLAPHLGRPYDILAGESLLTVRVYRGGTLASAGHNHLIASHALAGTVYVPADVLATSFEVRIPAAELTVDEPQLRAAELSADFPPDVPDSARAGTRRNMLGAAVLDADTFPEVVVRAERLEAPPGGAPCEVLAHLQIEVRGRLTSLVMPARYRLGDGMLTVSGEGPLRQTELGLTPFTALMGALAVQDQMQVRFRIVARAAAGAAGAH